MANPEHFEILKQGVEVWNRWRKQNASVRPDISGAKIMGFRGNWDFSEINLAGANLEGAEFTGVIFKGANFKRSNMQTANLNGSDFKEANLDGAYLSYAKLRRTDLQKATLSYAALIETDFRNAKLRESQIFEAVLKGAKFYNADLYMANLMDADLTKADFNRANLKEVILNGANLSEAGFCEADLTCAKLNGAKLHNVDFSGACLDRAELRDAQITEANLIEASFRNADLRGSILAGTSALNTDFDCADFTDADLRGVLFINTHINDANFSRCNIYGISAWDLIGKPAQQSDLIVTPEGQPQVTVDKIEVAQFIYLLLHNPNIRTVIDTIGEKGVLILGRFTPERKAVLDAIRDKLRELGFVPMMFDFEKPTQRDFAETIKTLAGMSRFIIADITNPKSAPLELQATMPDYMIPFVPIIHEGEEPFSMFRDLKQKYGEWVLDVLEYDSAEGLVDVMNDAVVDPALEMADKLIIKKAEVLSKRHVRDYRKP